MKTFFILAAVLVLGLILCSVPSDLRAQEEQKEYAYGTVKSVSNNSIIVTEFDYENEQEIDTTYSVEPATTELSNIASLDEITSGDNIELEYVLRNGKKVAVSISVWKQREEEPPIPAEPIEEEPAYPEESF
ncbi:MAG: hypothetical protein JW714_05205 [Candidatus Omnitrophica bacterium]|nr:hypothetical protein [Candidatus Omnitrophota bacterium]